MPGWAAQQRMLPSFFFPPSFPPKLPLALQTIAGIATALKQAASPTWQAYAKQVISNAQTLAAELVNYGYRLQTNGTENHLVLWDLRPTGVTGSKVEKICDLVGITINSAFESLFVTCDRV